MLSLQLLPKRAPFPVLQIISLNPCHTMLFCCSQIPPVKKSTKHSLVFLEGNGVNNQHKRTIMAVTRYNQKKDSRGMLCFSKAPKYLIQTLKSFLQNCILSAIYKLTCGNNIKKIIYIYDVWCLPAHCIQYNGNK